MERFIKEYANYKLKKLRKESLILDSNKNRAIAEIKRIVAVREKGLLTVEESMILLSKAEHNAWK